MVNQLVNYLCQKGKEDLLPGQDPVESYFANLREIVQRKRESLTIDNGGLTVYDFKRGEPIVVPLSKTNLGRLRALYEQVQPEKVLLIDSEGCLVVTPTELKENPKSTRAYQFKGLKEPSEKISIISIPFDNQMAQKILASSRNSLRR